MDSKKKENRDSFIQREDKGGIKNEIFTIRR